MEGKATISVVNRYFTEIGHPVDLIKLSVSSRHTIKLIALSKRRTIRHRSDKRSREIF
jgi:hypothetical protein